MFRMALLLCSTVAPLLATAEEWSFLVTEAESGSPLAGAIVLLPVPAERAAVEARIVQENRQFNPHVLVVPPGTEVSFPNRDNTQHHVYSFSPARTFEIELYAGIPEAPVRFDTSGVVELGCNIHDQMQAFILVTDQQYGITNDSGELTLTWPDEQPFPETIHAWHPRQPDNTRLMDIAVDNSRDESTTLALEVDPAPETDSSLERLQQRFREL